MLIHIGYDIGFELPSPAEACFALSVHPSCQSRLRSPERLEIQPRIPFTTFIDSFGNQCGRARLPAGSVRFTNSALIEDDGQPDPVKLDAFQHAVTELPAAVLPFLLPSRYCEVDSELADVAWGLCGAVPGGWGRVQTICDFVHQHIRFDYLRACATRTAVQGYREKVGVCRDFMHLAIALCRCVNIPARYATGYLGDIAVPPVPCPMDFSAWFQVFLDHRWWTFDARHNQRRVGRVLMAVGRDAADVALTTIFGRNVLTKFVVETEEVTEQAGFNHGRVACEDSACSISHLVGA